MKNIRLVATDLDGTFLRDDKTISERNLRALDLLGARNVIRVVATGRNLRKVNEVIPGHIPFDFIVFSSGAGVYDCQEQQHIYSQNISASSGNRLIQYLLEQDLNFHAFWPVPENHNLWYHRGSEQCEEFERYFSFHNSYAYPLPENNTIETGLCQFLVVLPGDVQRFETMKSNIEEMCPEVRIIRSSSPLNTGYIWMEIFHKSVSKGNGVLHLCNRLNISPGQTLGIGNDYNDLDLLEFTEHSFLTDNAPEILKNSFSLLPTNEEDAFAHAVERIIYE
jgi:Cof subfamily protein (haloacid dehalogenase superfamily)